MLTDNERKKLAEWMGWKALSLDGSEPLVWMEPVDDELEYRPVCAVEAWLNPPTWSNVKWLIKRVEEFGWWAGYQSPYREGAPHMSSVMPQSYTSMDCKTAHQALADDGPTAIALAILSMVKEGS